MSVAEYLDAAPEPQQATLRSLRATLRALLPEATEALSYGVPALLVDGRPVAGYGWAKGHCSYYPHSGSVLAQAADLLEGYDWPKGTLRFAVDQPLPDRLVQRLVELRLDQLTANEWQRHPARASRAPHRIHGYLPPGRAVRDQSQPSTHASRAGPGGAGSS